jgi:uncharacterized protein YvpB
MNLPVQPFKQEHDLTCEAACMRMALSLKGVFTTEEELMGLMNYDPRQRNRTVNQWDDPSEMFVGFCDGRQGEDGWGVMPTPVIEACGRMRVPAYKTAAFPQFIVNLLHSGSVVMLWTNYTNELDSWTVKRTCTKVVVPKKEHTILITGYEGNRSDPIHFNAHDPCGITRHIPVEHIAEAYAAVEIGL